METRLDDVPDERKRGSGVAQPRPALGLRPWFAFLRRARSLRRFAFAMRARLPAEPLYSTPASVTLRGGSWVADGVVVATSFGERLTGIRNLDASGVLLHTSSVHGRGLSSPLRLIHLSRSGTVIGEGLLAPDRIVRSRSYWVLELPLSTPAPPQGTRLTVVPSSPV